MAVLRDRNGRFLRRDSGARSRAEILVRASGRGADFSGADLSGEDLSGIDVWNLGLVGADLSGADLSDSRFIDVDAHDALLKGAGMRRTQFRGSDLSGADMSDADAREADVSGSWMVQAKAWGMDLSGARVGDSNMAGSQLGKVRARDATFEAVDLHGASAGGGDFSSSVINMSHFSAFHGRGAFFTNVHVARTSFDDSDLRNTSWDGSAIIKNSFRNSVFHGAHVRCSRIRDSSFEGADMRGCGVASNSYSGVRGRTAEMAADVGADRAVKGTSKAAAYAMTAGVFAYGFMNAPEQVTDLVRNDILGKGAVGFAASIVARGAVAKGAGWINRNVIPRIQSVMSRTAPHASQAAARIPVAHFMHRAREFRFTFMTGFSERRVRRMVDAVNRSDRKRGDPIRAAGFLPGKDAHLVVTRDRESLDRFQSLLARGDKPVVAMRLTEDGTPRESGPAIYQYETDGSMTAVWFNRGRPDMAANFGADGRIRGRRTFSARDRAVRDGEPLSTKVLARGNASRRQLETWLRSEEAAVSGGAGLKTAAVLRDAAGYLDNAADMMPRSAAARRRRAKGVSAALARFGAERNDNVAAQAHYKRVSRASKAVAGAAEAMECQGLLAYSAIGRRIEKRLEGVRGFLEPAREDENADQRSARIRAEARSGKAGGDRDGDGGAPPGGDTEPERTASANTEPKRKRKSGRGGDPNQRRRRRDRAPE